MQKIKKSELFTMSISDVLKMMEKGGIEVVKADGHNNKIESFKLTHRKPAGVEPKEVSFYELTRILRVNQQLQAHGCLSVSFTRRAPLAKPIFVRL